MRHEKLPLTADQLDTCRELWPRGDNKVAAIKQVRNFTGAGLRESKEFVESDYDFTQSWVSPDSTKETQFVLKAESVAQLVGRLFELSAEIADIHNQLAAQGVKHDDKAGA